MPVYEVKPESGNGRTRVLHRNLLLPCSFLPVETHLSHLRVVIPCQGEPTGSRLREETTGTIDEHIPSLTPVQLQEFYESTRLTEDSCETVPKLVEQRLKGRLSHNIIGHPKRRFAYTL